MRRASVIVVADGALSFTLNSWNTQMKVIFINEINSYNALSVIASRQIERMSDAVLVILRTWLHVKFIVRLDIQTTCHCSKLEEVLTR